MITNKELEISNKSYTGKDFATIYPELIELISKTTNRWDPTTANESDPGIVLEKTNAYIADKLNYNIDKNILERFMPSATQETSMRYLCSIQGYEMKYFIAPEVSVRFTYLGNKLNASSENESNKKIIIPKFSVLYSSASGDETLKYILTKSVSIADDNIWSSPVLALQGELKDLKMSNSNIITLENLDDNNCIYFPEKNVAENGVFIKNIDDESDSYWERVFYLSTVDPDIHNIYSFGYDSQRGLPYIQFADDIASYIKNGLAIKYIVTNGESGNIPANYLDAIEDTLYIYDENELEQEELFDEDETQTIVVTNPGASIKGANPETINEAYNNYKKTIGTFDTLVTCRDYANKIYYLTNDEDVNLVSNCQVTDRRTDINYGTKVVTYDEYGISTINVNHENHYIYPYELCLYPLLSVAEPSDYAVTDGGYLATFRPLTSISTIASELEEEKTMSHDYKQLNYDDIYLIKNYAKLDVKLSTVNKVNEYDRKTIINNVKTALAKNFNSRELDYGYEIPYEILTDVIIKSDSRIKSANIAEPVLETKVMLYKGDEIPLISTAGIDAFSRIVTRNILEGKVSLFNFYDDFKFDFGEINGQVVENISKITSEVEINLKANSEYTLKENEVIQIISPSYVTSMTYTIGCKYTWTGSSLAANKVYTIRENETLEMTYTDADGNKKTQAYSEGTIIKPSFTLNTETGKALNSSETIEIISKNIVNIETAQCIYWLVNNAENNLFKNITPVDGKYIYTLGDNEYFFYTNTNKDYFNSVSSGTTIIIPAKFVYNNNFVTPKLDIETILEKGVLTIGDNLNNSLWKSVSFSKNAPLTIQENGILTLTSQDKIQSDTDITINNENVELSNETIRYLIQGETDYEVAVTQDAVIRSRLDISAGIEYNQTLENTTGTSGVSTSTQKVEFIPAIGDIITAEDGDSFNFNTDLYLAGGENLDVSSLEKDDNGELVPIYPLKAYNYTYDANITPFTRDINNMAKFGFSADAVGNVNLSLSNLNNKATLVMLFIKENITDGSTNSSIKVDTNSSATLKDFNTGETISSSDYLQVGLTTLLIAPNTGVSKVELNFAKESTSNEAALIVSPIKYLNTVYYGYELNPQLGIDTFAEELGSSVATTLYNNIIDKVKEESDGKYYYLYNIDNSRVIEEDNLASPYAFFDVNNVANRFTMCEIDFKYSNIDVVRGSRL